ncbi:MAG: alkaline phosphatase family protein [Deltaproteobacteria bacterium]|nr:alkaline phosphatase family protein [Deltaproteobacteria bacterium]
MSFRRALMVMIDGARADCFEQLVARGDLPNISRYLIERGSYRRAVTAFPSTTGPAYLPFLTGCLPATCNVPGIRWMEKARYRDGGRRGIRSYVGIETFRINPDITPGIETLFSIFPESYNVFNSVCRDVPFWHNLTRFIRILYWYYAHLTDRWAFVDAAAAAKLLSVIERDFQFGFVVFPGVDEYSHLDDPFGEETRAAYRVVDAAIGKGVHQLKRRGMFDETVWWIISDHGLSSTHTHFCMNRFLESAGRRPLYYPMIHRRRCRAANMMSGNGMTHLYFRHATGWRTPMTMTHLEEESPDLLPRLLEEPAVDLAAVRVADGRIALLCHGGRATIEWVGAQIRYTDHGGDPLQLMGHTGSCHRQFSAEQVLCETADARYPDAAYQLAHLFRSPRTGDVVVSATPGYDLRAEYETPEHRSSHGSLHRDHMIVPLVCNVPLAEGPLRTVDVFPTTLHLMGRAAVRPIDGSVRAVT